MTPEMSDDDRQQIVDALFAGRKIDAIKIYRAAMGTDLKTAHDFIRELEARLRLESPEKFAARSSVGCSPAAIIFVIVVAMFAGGAIAAFLNLGEQIRAPNAPAAPPAQPRQAGQPQGPVNASDPATPVDPAQEQAAPFAGDLTGKWRLDLPAGFEHPAELERVDPDHYRLRTVGVMNGVYQLRGNRLVMETPVDPQQAGMWKFRWQIDDDNQLTLIGQPDPIHYGGHYLGATLVRAGP